MLTYSYEGECINPLIISKSKNPRAFKGVDLSAYDVTYEANDSAWLKKDLFERYMRNLNEKMKTQNRKILILLDNFSGHKIGDFENIRFHFFPPNTTSKIQPLDMGIIASFKSKYRRLLNNFIFDLILDDDEGTREVSRELNIKMYMG